MPAENTIIHTAIAEIKASNGVRNAETHVRTLADAYGDNIKHLTPNEFIEQVVMHAPRQDGGLGLTMVAQELPNEMRAGF